ncbi:hypothetical protein AR687_00170 [Flavobacteriaceae bacterium CRH]|nr:hypothetical protein AR687_00170 [Flavobacteriaceae bacterium CRH]
MNNKTNLAFSTSAIIPARVINIAVDTVYLYSQTSGPYSGTGIYMMDNNAIGGSTGEGGLELSSQVTAGFGIAFNAFPIDAAGQQGDTVEIVGFEISNGTNIFGNWGWPSPQQTGSYQWLGTAMIQGQCTYQIKIGVSVGGAPKQYYWWDPFLTCTA